MLIPHLKDASKLKTKFYPDLLRCLRSRGPIEFGETISYVLPTQSPSGLEGDVIVDIVDGLEFDSSWKGKDRTWFGARIKAAATALRDSDQHGRFRISHKNGERALTIQKVQWETINSINLRRVLKEQSDSDLATEIEVSHSLPEAERARRLAAAAKIPERV